MATYLSRNAVPTGGASMARRRRHHRWGALVAALLLVALLPGAAQPAFAAAALSVSPTSGPAGSSITFSGSGYAANETVNIDDNGTLYTRATTDSGGDFTKNSTAPLSSGIHQFTGTGQTSGRKASCNFTVT